MNWIESISRAIEYIEDNIMNEISIEDIAQYACISPFYFQKGFSMLCGYTVGEYIRKRRLSLAGKELLSTHHKVIDIALKYGYDSPDSFTRAFVRFHGVTPISVRKEQKMIKIFAPLRINFTLKGGYTMNYRIVEKEAFTVMGISRKLKYENAMIEVPKLWQDFIMRGMNKHICGMYGINMDLTMGGSEEFEYMIADQQDSSIELLDEFITKEIPKHTWAIFACIGPSHKTIQDINTKIFTEWLPNCKDYEIAEGYNIEMYSDASQYPKGVLDEHYYCEIWIPVKRK